MDFQVTTSDQVDEFFVGDDKFEILDNGVLVVDQGKKRFHYSPNTWVLVTEKNAEANRPQGVFRIR